jgi:hypothetical protein
MTSRFSLGRLNTLRFDSDSGAPLLGAVPLPRVSAMLP